MLNLYSQSICYINIKHIDIITKSKSKEDMRTKYHITQQMEEAFQPDLLSNINFINVIKETKL